MDMVRITNTRPTILHLPDNLAIAERGDIGDRIAGYGTGKSLGPGGHNIDEATWNAAKKNKQVASWLQIGWLKEGGDVAAPEGPEAPKSLRGYGAPAAIAIAQSESNAEILRAWEASDSRIEVLAAIRARLASVAPSAKLEAATSIPEKRGPGRPKKAT